MPISADNAEKLGQFFIGSIAIFRKDRGCIPARTLATWSSIACQATQGNRFHVEGAVEPKTTFNTPLSLTAFWRSKPSSVYDANMTAADANRLFGGMLEHIAKPCAIAVFFVLVALLWTFLLQHVIAYPFVFLFFGAVMGSAWFGGFIAGFLAVVLSSLRHRLFLRSAVVFDFRGQGIAEFLGRIHCVCHRHHDCELGEEAGRECDSDCPRPAGGEGAGTNGGVAAIESRDTGKRASTAHAD